MKRQSGFPIRWPLWLALLLLWAMPAQADKQVLTVAWSHWPPFSQLNNKGELAGLDISLTRQILTKAGFTPKFREIPWARALHLVEHGQLDIAMGALALPEREQYARFSAPYRHSAYVLLSNDPIPGQQDRWPVTRPSLRCATPRGSRSASCAAPARCSSWKTARHSRR
jgi:polar amino acid transport system substrate-binding protein